MNQTILQQKQALVEEISKKIGNAGSTVVVEYRGLTVAEVTELRRALRAEGCEMIVYKNSMTQRAAEQLGYHDLLQSLTGPNAIAVRTYPPPNSASHPTSIAVPHPRNTSVKVPIASAKYFFIIFIPPSKKLGSPYSAGLPI